MAKDVGSGSVRVGRQETETSNVAILFYEEVRSNPLAVGSSSLLPTDSPLRWIPFLLVEAPHRLTRTF